MRRGRPRILIVSLGGSFGGVEHYLTGLTEFLEEGAEIYVLTQQPELRRRLSARAVHLLSVPDTGKSLRLLLGFLLTPWFLIFHRIDILQVNGYVETVFAMWARLLGRRVICTRHGDFDTESYTWYAAPQKFFPRWLCLVFSKLATCVVCVSETVGRDVLRHVPAQRVAVIRNWVGKIPIFSEPSGGGTLRLLYVGRLERYKGVHLIIEAMRTLAGVELTVVGDGAYRLELERMSADLPVTFTGFKTDPAPYYQAADIFIMPSLGPEGLPLSPIEAAAAGLPLVLSSLPVHLEIAAEGTAGAIFRSGDAVDLRSRIIALRDLSERQRLARAAYDVVVRCFNPSLAKQSYRRLFGLVEILP